MVFCTNKISSTQRFSGMANSKVLTRRIDLQLLNRFVLRCSHLYLLRLIGVRRVNCLPWQHIKRCGIWIMWLMFLKGEMRSCMKIHVDVKNLIKESCLTFILIINVMIIQKLLLSEHQKWTFYTALVLHWLLCVFPFADVIMTSAKGEWTCNFSAHFCFSEWEFGKRLLQMHYTSLPERHS